MKFKAIFRKFKKHDKTDTLNKSSVKSPSSQIPTQNTPQIRTSPILPQIKTPTPISPQFKSSTPISPQFKSSTQISPQFKSPTQISSQIKSPIQISPQFKSPNQISSQIKSPNQISPQFKSPNQISSQIKSPTQISPQFKSPNQISSQIKLPIQISPQFKSSNQISSQIPIPIPTSVLSSISTPISTPSSSPINSPNTISPTIGYPIQPIDFPKKRQYVINNYNICNSDVILSYNNNSIYNNRKYSNSSSASSNSLYISFPPPPAYKNIQSPKKESCDLNQDSLNTSIASTIPSPTHREPYLLPLASSPADTQKITFHGKISNNELMGTSPNETLNSHAVTLVNSNDGGTTDFTIKNSSINPSAVTLHKDDSEVSEDFNNNNNINGNIQNLEKDMYHISPHEYLHNERIYYSNVNNIQCRPGVLMIHNKLQKSSTSLPVTSPTFSPINSPPQNSPTTKSPSEKKRNSIFGYLRNKKDKKKEKELRTVYNHFSVVDTTSVGHEGLISPGNYNYAVYNLWEQRNSDIKKRNSELTNNFNLRKSSISSNLSPCTSTSMSVLNSPNIESPKTINNMRPSLSPYHSYNRGCRNSNININDNNLQQIHPKSYLFNFPLPTPKSKISTLESDSGKSCISNSSTNKTVISSPNLKLELPRRSESLYNEISKNLPGRRISQSTVYPSEISNNLPGRRISQSTVYPSEISNNLPGRRISQSIIYPNEISNNLPGRRISQPTFYPNEISNNLPERRISQPSVYPNVLQTSPNQNSLNIHSNSMPTYLSKEKCSCNETVKLNTSTENTSLAKETKSSLIKNCNNIKNEKENIKGKEILQNKKEEIKESSLPHDISEPNTKVKTYITSETIPKENHIPNENSEPNTEIKMHATTETTTEITEPIKLINIVDNAKPSLKYNVTPSNSSKKSTLENIIISKDEKLKNDFNQPTNEEISKIAKRSSNSSLNNSYSYITESSRDLDLLYSYYQNSTPEANKKVMKQEIVNESDVERIKPIKNIKELKKPDIYKSLLNKRSSGILKNKNSYSILKNKNSNLFLYNNINTPSSSNKSDISIQSLNSFKSNNKVNFCESKNLYRNITINKNNDNLRPSSIGSNSIPFIVEKSLNQTTILNESSVKFDNYNTTESFSILKGNFDESLNSNINYSESEIIFEDINFSKDLHSLYSFNISYDGDGEIDVVENQEKEKTDPQILNNKTNSSSSSNEDSVNQTPCNSNDDEEISEFFKSHSGNRTSFIVIGKENENNSNQNNTTQNSKVTKRESQCSNKLPRNILTSLNSSLTQENLSSNPSSNINDQTDNTEFLTDKNTSSISSRKTEPYIKSTAFIDDDSKSKIRNEKYKSTGDLDTNKDFSLLDLDLRINLDLNIDINDFNKKEEEISSNYYDINNLKNHSNPNLDRKLNNEVPLTPSSKNVNVFRFNEIKKLINDKRNSNVDTSTSSSSLTEKEKSENHIKFNDHEIKKLKNQKRESKNLNTINLIYENSNNNTVDSKLSLPDTTSNCKKNEKSSRNSIISVKSVNNMDEDVSDDNLIKKSNNLKPSDNSTNNIDNTHTNYRNSACSTNITDNTQINNKNSTCSSPIVINQVDVNNNNNNIASKSKERLSIIDEEPIPSNSVIQSKLYKNKGKRKAIILPRNDSLKILEDQYFKEKIDNNVVYVAKYMDNKGRKNIKSQCYSNISLQNNDLHKMEKSSNNITIADDNNLNVSNNNKNEKYMTSPKVITSPTINSYEDKTKSLDSNNVQFSSRTSSLITSHLFFNRNALKFNQVLNGNKNQALDDNKNQILNGNKNQALDNNKNQVLNGNKNQALDNNKNQVLNSNKNALKFNQTLNDNKNALKFNQTLNDNKNALKFNQALNDNKNKNYQSIPKEVGSSTTIYNNKRENKIQSQNNNIKFTNRTSSLINPTSLPSPLLFSKNVLKVRQEGIPAMRKLSSKTSRISSSSNAHNQKPNSKTSGNVLNNEQLMAKQSWETKDDDSLCNNFDGHRTRSRSFGPGDFSKYCMMALTNMMAKNGNGSFNETDSDSFIKFSQNFLKELSENSVASLRRNSINSYNKNINPSSYAKANDFTDLKFTDLYNDIVQSNLSIEELLQRINHKN